MLRSQLVLVTEVRRQSLRPRGQLEGISNAYNAEERLNNLRNNLRDAEIEEIESNRKNYQTSVYYMDIVSELEKMGDFIINISQNLAKVFVKK